MCIIHLFHIFVKGPIEKGHPGNQDFTKKMVLENNLTLSTL